MSEIALYPWCGFNVASTFSGCGGSSLGYKMAGMKVLYANEFIPAAQETYRANHPSTHLDTRDIRTVQPEDVLAACGCEHGGLHLFDGSPPCSSFSMAGIREDGWGRVKKYSDSEQRTDDLFFEYARLIAGIQPWTFVAENVKGLTVGAAKDLLGDFQRDMFSGQSFRSKPDEEGQTRETLTRDEADTILGTLRDCGYKVGYRVLNAMNLGVPQSRQRIIFVGVRKDIADDFGVEPVWPSPLGYVYSIRDAVPWILGIHHDSMGHEGTRDFDVDAEPFCTLRCPGGGAQTRYFVEAESNIEKYAIGKEWDNLKIGEQSEKYFSLVKPDPERPCPTITQTAGNPGAAGVVHPTEKRKFSIFELRRLCGFPDDFVLTGSFLQQWERLGRAVPPPMMMRVAEAVRDRILRPIVRQL